MLWLLAAVVNFTSTQANYVGLIGYFEGNCPEGWRLYENLIGRVIVGAGNYSGIAYDGRNETASFVNGNTGGERQTMMTVEEMPPHNHDNGNHKHLLSVDCFGTVICIDNECTDEPKRSCWISLSLHSFTPMTNKYICILCRFVNTLTNV